jgi:hypothetical protein
MATLTGKTIANTYKQLLQIGSNNTGISGSLQTVQDGNATNTALQLSNSTVNINGTFQLNGSTLTATASVLNAVADLTGATGFVAVSAGQVYGRTLVEGTGIAITNADGTEGNPVISLNETGLTVSVAAVKANAGTIDGTISATYFVGDGSGLTNVPSAEGGTVKFITAGTGVNITVDASSSATIPVSGTIGVAANQSFGTVSVSTGLVVPEGAVTFAVPLSGSSAVFSGNVSAAGFYIGGDSVATSSQVAAVSALTSVNLAAITSINSVIDNLDFATSAELATVSSTMATSINNSNTVIAAVSALTSVNLAAITSINTVVTNLSATMATSIANVSATMATSINNSNIAIANVSALTSVNLAAVTSINTVVTNLSATMATSIANSNTAIAVVSALTSINLASITSINTVITNLSATMATSIANVSATMATSIANVSATMATSIANHLRLSGGTLTGTVSGTDFYVSAVAIGVDALLGKQLHLGTAAVADLVSLTDGTSIAVNFNSGQNFVVQLGGNRTLESPTNCVAGQTGSIFIVQDGTGSRTLSYGGSWKFVGGTAPTLSTAISAVDRLDYIVYTSTNVHSIASLDIK